jgi:hypothetical protein
MNETWYTAYHGDSWEEMCNVLLSLKHGTKYQPISDKGGDMGLDGLVLSDGIAYQAYGQESENQNPTKGIKDKIRDDLNKLKKNEKDIFEVVGDAKISKWVLLLNLQIPSSSIHTYAKTKEDDVKSWNLPFISDDFRVFVQPPSYFETEYLEYKKKKDERIEINISTNYAPSLSGLRQHDQFLAVLEKFKKISPESESVAEHLAYKQFKEYFENAEQLSQVRKKEPDFYSEIEDIRFDVEAEAEEGSLLSGSFDSMSQTKNVLETRLNNKIGSRLGSNTLSRVRKYIIADWFVRCPLDFKKQE